MRYLPDKIDTAPYHCFFKIPFVDRNGKGKLSLINRNRNNAMTGAIHPLGISIQKNIISGFDKASHP